MIDTNVWGTDKSLIDPDEFCVECECEVPRHYANCPLYHHLGTISGRFTPTQPAFEEI